MTQEQISNAEKVFGRWDEHNRQFRVWGKIGEVGTAVLLRVGQRINLYYCVGGNRRDVADKMRRDLSGFTCPDVNIEIMDGVDGHGDYGHVVNFYLTRITNDNFYAQLPEVCRLVKIVLAKLGELGYLAGGTFV